MYSGICTQILSIIQVCLDQFTLGMVSALLQTNQKNMRPAPGYVRAQASSLPLWWSKILAASTWSPWLAIWSGARPFLVFDEMGAPLWTIMSTTFSWPERAAQCSGVRPSLVLASKLAPLSKSKATILALPHLAATCRGVMLCYNIKYYLDWLEIEFWVE